MGGQPTITHYEVRRKVRPPRRPPPLTAATAGGQRGHRGALAPAPPPLPPRPLPYRRRRTPPASLDCRSGSAHEISAAEPPHVLAGPTPTRRPLLGSERSFGDVARGLS